MSGAMTLPYMVRIDKDVFLPESLRDELKRPFGELLECAEIPKRVKVDGKLVAIGDSVASCLIRSGVSPSLIIWDGKTKRLPAGPGDIKVLESYAKAKRVKNPPAMITKAAWDAVVSALSEDKASLLVDGEEDLLAIPVILNAPLGTRVVYGLPDKGAILIAVDRKIKASFEDILSRFK